MSTAPMRYALPCSDRAAALLSIQEALVLRIVAHLIGIFLPLACPGAFFLS